MFSFDVGYTHFIAFSTEFYFFWKEYGFEQLAVQWKWLLEDLKVGQRFLKSLHR